ncbi:uncharacterized protein A1O9_05737 [Exophiala aquamarina CBS 119918]|uniref:HhH-GPD domain-containing protein n=1 Tax=Exophiala aquamarina CBS 119918 TaxID=1182545 RepID=A0A072PDJ8_9EURO|nr:uncharacterized protein A1O9_05737 [Exophiala aquamarina CBS 119918]KEF57817.1 hypothetical protein A1O9_05737 [Exophiala aquamarina CBS 119918]
MEKRKHTRLRRVVPSSNRFNFTFGRSVLAYHNWVRQVDINNVARILKEERPSLLAQISQNDATTPPMHAGQTFSVDAIVRVMLSQSSTNEGALDAQQCMIHAYPYMVNGVKVIGTIPNYHLMRVQSAKKLEMVLTRAGLQEKKAKYIKRCLDEIYCHNVSLISPGEVVYRFNDPNASDFVPGLLSVDYISEIYATKGKQAVFDCLVRFMMIGIKSAFCIMAFRMNIPVFAVDTHVAGMVKLLGWVPQDATEDEMCSHLDFMIEDDDKKVDLHQDFWRHRRACDRCGGRSLPGSWNYENAICPLEHLITRPVPRRSLERPSKGSPQRPRTPTVKKVDEDALRGQGMIEVTYLVDDDFDALTSAIVMRTAWIDDYSMLEADVQMMGEEVEEVEEVEMQSQATEVS